jgi:hypothetical protein
MQPMVVDDKVEVRRIFSARFSRAADKIDGCPKGHGRAAWLHKHVLKELSAWMISRYISGSDMPSAARWQYVADSMGTSIAFLRGEIDEDDPYLVRLLNAYQKLNDVRLREQLARYAEEFMVPLAPHPTARAKDRRVAAAS